MFNIGGERMERNWKVVAPHITFMCVFAFFLLLSVDEIFGWWSAKRNLNEMRFSCQHVSDARNLRFAPRKAGFLLGRSWLSLRDSEETVRIESRATSSKLSRSSARGETFVTPRFDVTDFWLFFRLIDIKAPSNSINTATTSSLMFSSNYSNHYLVNVRCDNFHFPVFSSPEPYTFFTLLTTYALWMFPRIFLLPIHARNLIQLIHVKRSREEKEKKNIFLHAFFLSFLPIFLFLSRLFSLSSRSSHHLIWLLSLFSCIWVVEPSPLYDNHHYHEECLRCNSCAINLTGVNQKRARRFKNQILCDLHFAGEWKSREPDKCDRGWGCGRGESFYHSASWCSNWFRLSEKSRCQANVMNLSCLQNSLRVTMTDIKSRRFGPAPAGTTSVDAD